MHSSKLCRQDDVSPFCQTVKYFGGEQHEAERYREAIRNYQVLEFKVMGKTVLESTSHDV